ncbi:MAG: hypothetical protein JXB05_36140 [Myxococcaceae bacterium]|nr:hypothetical protein [Myxococcaceae bacterium]
MHRTVIAALVLLAACAPPETQSPVKVQALVYSNGKYSPQEVQLTTVSDIVRLEGTVAKMLGGARIVSDSQDPELQAAETAPDPEKAFAEALIKSDGRPVTASYIDHAGVLWPADFHTWNLVTAYYNFERAYDYFQALGMTAAEFNGPATVFYFPDFILKDIDPEPLRDNAIFFSPTHSLMVLPFDALQDAPLAINPGIMAHEYSHRIFNLKVYGGSMLPFPILEWGSQSASVGANLIKSLDEGLADYHAYGVTCRNPSGCNPQLLLSTSFDGPLGDIRDLSNASRCMDTALLQSLTQASLGEFSGQGNEYKVGSILASALYQAGESTGQREVLQRAILSSYSGLQQLALLARGNQQNFNLTSVSAVFITSVTDVQLKTALCNELIDHLQVPAAELVGPGKPCPAAAQGGTTCPRLP